MLDLSQRNQTDESLLEIKTKFAAVARTPELVYWWNKYEVKKIYKNNLFQLLLCCKSNMKVHLTN